MSLNKETKEIEEIELDRAKEIVRLVSRPRKNLCPSSVKLGQLDQLIVRAQLPAGGSSTQLGRVFGGNYGPVVEHGLIIIGPY